MIDSWERNPTSSKNVVICASFSVGFPPFPSKKVVPGEQKKERILLMNPMHSQKVSIVHFFATQKLTQSHPSENAWFLQFFGCKKSAQFRLFENVWLSSVGFSPFFVPQGQLFWREREETHLKNLHKPLLSLKR